MIAIVITMFIVLTLLAIKVLTLEIRIDALEDRSDRSADAPTDVPVYERFPVVRNATGSEVRS